MNAINRQSMTCGNTFTDAVKNAPTEMARHVLDLRMHALLMFLGGLLVVYCGSRIASAMMVSPSGASEGLSSALAAIGVIAVFAALASFCGFEMVRSWRKATAISAQRHHVTIDFVIPLSIH